MPRMTWLLALVPLLTTGAAVSTSHVAIDVPLAPLSDGGVVVDLRFTAKTDPQGPPGWRMVDSFVAFRYELTLRDDTRTSVGSMMTQLASLAQDHKCFGWVQQTSALRAAGEVRCPTRAAATLETHLARLDASLALRRYSNAKIRYHFATFRVLSDAKYVGKTCFPTPPHACDPAIEV